MVDAGRDPAAIRHLLDEEIDAYDSHAGARDLAWARGAS